MKRNNPRKKAPGIKQGAAISKHRLEQLIINQIRQLRSQGPMGRSRLNKLIKRYPLYDKLNKQI